MSDSDKFEAQGRAHAALKDAKSSVATSKSVLLDYVERLDSTRQLVKKFIDDPLAKQSPSFLPLTEHLKAQIHRLFVAELDAQIDELAYTSQRVIDLQKQIDQF